MWRKSWTKISFSYSDLSFIWPKISFSYNDLSCTWPIHLFGDVKVLLAKDRNKVVVYKLEDETSRDTAVLGIPSWFRVGLTFVDSLVSPNSSNEIRGTNEASGEI